MVQGTRKELFVVRDGDGEGKSWWTKIGAAFENRDGSYTLVFDALPVNGRVQMRDPYKDPDADQGDRGGDRGGRGDDDVQGERRYEPLVKRQGGKRDAGRGRGR